MSTLRIRIASLAIALATALVASCGGSEDEPGFAISLSPDNPIVVRGDGNGVRVNVIPGEGTEAQAMVDEFHVEPSNGDIPAGLICTMATSCSLSGCRMPISFDFFAQAYTPVGDHAFQVRVSANGVQKVFPFTITIADPP